MDDATNTTPAEGPATDTHCPNCGGKIDGSHNSVCLVNAASEIVRLNQVIANVRALADKARRGAYQSVTLHDLDAALTGEDTR